ncbi:hypothetical protein HK101_005625, partial [Irineochytrium annulatum]
VPQEPVVAALLAMTPTFLQPLAEALIVRFWYSSDLKGMVPTTPLFSDTPCLNNKYLDLIRTNRVRYLRASVDRLTAAGVVVSNTQWDSRDIKRGGTKDGSETLEADVIVMATGYARGDFGFIGAEVWGDGVAEEGDGDTGMDSDFDTTTNATIVDGKTYAQALTDDIDASRPRGRFSPTLDSSGNPLSTSRPVSPTADTTPPKFFPPNLYMVTYPPAHPTAAFVNSAYSHGIASVGNFHIGILTAICLMFALDPSTQLSKESAINWVERRKSVGEGLSFFTYLQYLWWMISLMLSSPRRWRWIPFVLGATSYPKNTRGPGATVKEPDLDSAAGRDVVHHTTREEGGVKGTDALHPQFYH